MHEHKLTVLYRKALRQQLMPHLHDRLQTSGVQATVIEGGAGKTHVQICTYTCVCCHCACSMGCTILMKALTGCPVLFTALVTAGE
jgi:hypothetical protein